jgi:hypothetical protein
MNNKSSPTWEQPPSPKNKPAKLPNNNAIETRLNPWGKFVLSANAVGSIVWPSAALINSIVGDKPPALTVTYIALGAVAAANAQRMIRNPDPRHIKRTS